MTACGPLEEANFRQSSTYKIPIGLTEKELLIFEFSEDTNLFFFFLLSLIL